MGKGQSKRPEPATSSNFSKYKVHREEPWLSTAACLFPTLQIAHESWLSTPSSSLSTALSKAFSTISEGKTDGSLFIVEYKDLPCGFGVFVVSHLLWQVLVLEQQDRTIQNW